MNETYTEKQVVAWGQFTMIIGVIAITAAHMVMLLLGSPPLNWLWQGGLLLVLIPVGYIYRKQYLNEKDRKEE